MTSRSPATRPIPVPENRTVRHRYGGADTVFLGDAVITRWPAPLARQFQNSMFVGSDGETVANLLWRLRDEALPVSPRFIVLHIGEADLRIRSPKSVADGIAEATKIARLRFPESRVILLSVVPTSSTGASELAALLSDRYRRGERGRTVAWFDLGTLFAGRRFETDEGLSLLGYRLLTGVLQEAMGG